VVQKWVRPVKNGVKAVDTCRTYGMELPAPHDLDDWLILSQSYAILIAW